MKKILCLLLSLALLLAFGPPAQAADRISYYLPGPGLSLELPVSWDVFTHDTEADDPNLEQYFWNLEDLQDYLTESELYLEGYHPERDQSLHLYWGYQTVFEDETYTDYYQLSRSELRQKGRGFLAAYSYYNDYDFYTDEENQLTYLVLTGAYDTWEGDSYTFTEYYTLFDEYWLQIELDSRDGYGHAESLPDLEQAVYSLSFVGQPQQEPDTAGSQPGFADDAAGSPLLLGRPNPSTEYVFPSVITEHLNTLDAVLFYLGLFAAAVVLKALVALIRKLAKSRAAAKRQETYQKKLDQAQALGLRLDWYKALLYLLLPLYLLLSPLLTLNGLVNNGIYGSWPELFADIENTYLFFSFALSWLLLYLLRGQMRLFSRGVPLLFIFYVVYLLAQGLLIPNAVRPLQVLALALFLVLNSVYLFKRRRLFGPPPLLEPLPQAAIALAQQPAANPAETPTPEQGQPNSSATDDPAANPAPENRPPDAEPEAEREQ